MAPFCFWFCWVVVVENPGIPSSFGALRLVSAIVFFPLLPSFSHQWGRSRAGQSPLGLVRFVPTRSGSGPKPRLIAGIRLARI
jgi:hypothetical protein